MPMLVGDALDLVRSTLAKMPKGKWTSTLLYSAYTGAKIFFGDAKEEMSGGYQYEWRQRVRAAQGAKWVGLFEGVPLSIRDTMVVGAVPWAMYQSKAMGFDEFEQQFNQGAEQVVSLIEERREAAYEELFNMIENSLSLAGQTTPSTSDPPRLRGLPYYIAPCLTAANVPYTDTTGGFNGQCTRFDDGGNTTTIGSLDRSAAENTRTRNFNATYSGTVDVTCLDTLRTAMSQTNFESLPMVKGNPLRRSGQRYLLSDHGPANQYEKLVNAGPDDRNGDANPFGSNLTFRGVKWLRMPALANMSTIAPIYGVYTKSIYGVPQAGKWMKEMAPQRDDTAPTVIKVPVVGCGALACDNPRDQFVVHVPYAA